MEKFDWWWANWELLLSDDFDPTEVEDYAVAQVFGLLILDEIAEIEGRPIKDYIAVYEPVELERLLGTTMTDLTANVASFEAEGALYLSPAAGILVAELACRRHPAPVLELIVKEEAEKRGHCKHGSTFQAYDGSGERTSSPEWEYDYYRKHHRPRHELLRQCCSGNGVAIEPSPLIERLIAAEAEVKRLDILVAQLLDMVASADFAL